MTEREVFIEALRIADSGAQAEYVKRACGGDDQLVGRVSALLHAHRRNDQFLTTGETARFHFDSAVNSLSGTSIGRYKLLEQIGEGGFGVVYMAEQQEPVRRRVALKIIKPGMDSRQVVARFEAERQALAMMDHPNIARVLDAGSTRDGRPYFVMELVNGKPILEFCDQRKLTTEQRLSLFCDVCRAIQHAHQKGVIHRDIKPTNVLVTMHDTTIVPKVIDFGIAKAISHRLTEKTLFTRFGQMVGTPQYMSPEQAEMNDLDVDTRSDVYSLGVLLYELLTGRTPLDVTRLRAGGFAEMMRIIREEEPETPSSRLSSLGQDATTVSELRSTQPATLGKRLRADLDWVVMKSLEKDRTRRYQTANAFAEDIERHLKGEAVAAGPPSALYRVRKFVKRHRAAVVTASAILLTLLLGVVSVFLSRNEAIEEAAKSRQALELILEMIRSVDPTEGQGPTYTTREWLDEFSGKLDDQLVGQPADVRAGVLHTIGLAYTRLNMQYSAKPLIVEAARQYRSYYGTHKKTADCLIDLAMANILLCRFEEAEQNADEALSMYAHLGLRDDLTNHAAEVLHMARWDRTLRDLVDDSTLDFRHEEVNQEVDRILRETRLRTVGTLLASLLSLKLDVGDFEAAEAIAMGRITDTLTAIDHSPLRQMTEKMGKYYLGTLYQYLDRENEAQALFVSLKQDAMNYVPQQDIWMKMMYAWMLVHCGECGEVEFQRAKEMATDFARTVEQSPAMSMVRYGAYHTLAAVHARGGDYAAAVKAERVAVGKISPQHLFHRGQGEVALAEYLAKNGQIAEAAQVLVDGVAWRSSDLPETSVQRAAGEMNLAEFYLQHGRPQDAAPLLRQAKSRLAVLDEDNFYRRRHKSLWIRTL